MRWTLPAFAVWAIVTAAVGLADGEDRWTGGLGLIVFTAATVGLAVVAGRWALLAVVAILPLAALEGEAYDAMLLVVVAVPATALLVVAGLGMRRLVPGTAGLVMVGLALVAVLASTGAAQVDVDHHPRHPKLVDERDGGEFAGLHVGRPVGPQARLAHL